MNKILSVKGPDQDLAIEIEKVSAQYSADLRDTVEKAFRAADNQNFEKAAELCIRLLDHEAVPEVCMLLGICYFMNGHMQSAEKVFSDLTQDYPEKKEYHIYHGITNHALGRFEEAVKELGRLYPLDNHHPFYYTSYGDSLQQTGRLKQSRETFRKEVAFFEKTGEIVSAQILDGAFQNLLYLDITLGNGQYPEDMKLYYDFLDQTEMTPEMQENLAGNIVYFCSLMSNKWYRPLFLEFINHIRNKGYLTDGGALEVLGSAFASWESFAYHEDREISALVESYLAASYERKYSEAILTEEERTRLEITALTYDWYMCQYAPEHPKEIDYIREKYPYTYANNREFLEKIRTDKDGISKKVMDELYMYAHDVSRQEFERSMIYTYKKACEDKKEPAYVYDGMETYRRIQPKVGRNDPCPCGSGKKYKKCCGK